jgi:hypothetical protein
MSPLALCNFIAYDQLNKGGGGESSSDDTTGKKQCVVALDMGTDSSNLVITDGGRIIWQRPIPIGGNHFTRALTKDLKLTFAKAEHLKRNAAKSPDLRRILASLKSVLNDFVGEVQRSLGYFTNTHRDAQIKYMIGLGNAFRLPGLKQFLTEKLQLEVRKLGKFERMNGDAVTAAPTFVENIMGFGVAYGLALQGLKQARLHTNLLPHEVRVERLVRGKKPWAAAAAAALLLGIAFLASAKGFENKQLTGEEIDREVKQADSVIKLVQSNKSSFDAEVSRIDQSRQNLEKLSAGTSQRFNWQLLTEYINYALPLATGERLAITADDGAHPREKYDTKEAKQALFKFEARRFPKLDEAIDKVQAARDDQFIKENLIQVNIEGVMPLYSDDLHPYFRKIHKDTNLLLGMDVGQAKRLAAFATAKEQEAKDKADLPKAGWVIEIRGYTYHKDQMKFVEYSLLENLRTPEYRRNKDWYQKQPKEVKDQLDDMDKAIREKIGFILLYKEKVVHDPQPGTFDLIGQSFLRSLIKGEGEGGGEQGSKPTMGQGDLSKMSNKMPNAGGEGKETAETKVSRDGWSAIGERASALLGGGGGGGVSQGGAGFAPSAGGGERSSAMLSGGGKAGGSYIPPQNKGGPMAGGGGAFIPGGGGETKEPKSNGGSVTQQPRTEFVILFVWQEPLPAASTAAAAPEGSPPPGTPPGIPPGKKGP